MSNNKQTMLAARYLAPNRIEAVEVPVPAIGPNEALVKIDACGFCGSDIGIISGVHPRARAPLTIGHECSGIIAAIDSPLGSFSAGDPVTVYPLISCGHCSACLGGNAHVCKQLRLYGFDAEGAMAEYVKVPVANLVRLPADMTSEVGALIEPLAVAVHAVARAPRALAANTAVVIGAGPIGLLTALAAKARNIKQVLISDVLESRLRLAKELNLSAISASELPAHVRDLTNGEGAELVFECAGSAAAAKVMTEIVRPRGTIVNVSVFKKPAEVDLQAINFRELTVVGSRVYTRSDFEEAIRLASSMPLGKLITNIFPLRAAPEAYESFHAGDGACKVMVRP